MQVAWNDFSILGQSWYIILWVVLITLSVTKSKYSPPGYIKAYITAYLETKKLLFELCGRYNSHCEQFPPDQLEARWRALWEELKKDSAEYELPRNWKTINLLYHLREDTRTRRGFWSNRKRSKQIGALLMDVRETLSNSFGSSNSSPSTASSPNGTHGSSSNILNRWDKESEKDREKETSKDKTTKSKNKPEEYYYSAWAKRKYKSFFDSLCKRIMWSECKIPLEVLEPRMKAPPITYLLTKIGTIYRILERSIHNAIGAYIGVSLAVLAPQLYSLFSRILPHLIVASVVGVALCFYEPDIPSIFYHALTHYKEERNAVDLALPRLQHARIALDDLHAQFNRVERAGVPRSAIPFWVLTFHEESNVVTANYARALLQFLDIEFYFNVLPQDPKAWRESMLKMAPTTSAETSEHCLPSDRELSGPQHSLVYKYLPELDDSDELDDPSPESTQSVEYRLDTETKMLVESLIGMLTDTTRSGFVTPHDFAAFVDSFGPLQLCVERVIDLLQEVEQARHGPRSSGSVSRKVTIQRGPPREWMWFESAPSAQFEADAKWYREHSGLVNHILYAVRLVGNKSFFMSLSPDSNKPGVTVPIIRHGPFYVVALTPILAAVSPHSLGPTRTDTSQASGPHSMSSYFASLTHIVTELQSQLDRVTQQPKGVLPCLYRTIELKTRRGVIATEARNLLHHGLRSLLTTAMQENGLYLPSQRTFDCDPDVLACILNWLQGLHDKTLDIGKCLPNTGKPINNFTTIVIPPSVPVISLARALRYFKLENIRYCFCPPHDVYAIDLQTGGISKLESTSGTPGIAVSRTNTQIPACAPDHETGPARPQLPKDVTTPLAVVNSPIATIRSTTEDLLPSTSSPPADSISKPRLGGLKKLQKTEL